MHERVITILICVFGLVAISYGIIKENDLIFILGLPFLIGGYLLIRKRLKSSIREDS